MPGVFISYRREDSSGYTGRLYDILSAHFGKDSVYMDLDTIEGGDDFIDVIEEKLKLCDVLIAVIGSRWLTVTEKSENVRRLDKPSDFVRSEISKALTRGIRVIPVLVGGAVMPGPDDLPGDLRELSERQAMEIRDSHFHADAGQVVEVLNGLLYGSGFGRFKARRKWLIASIAGAGVLAAILAGALWSPQPIAVPPAVIIDVSGKWIAVVKYDWGDTYTNTFDFKMDGARITGTAGFAADKPASGRPILDGQISGTKITFSTKSLVLMGSEHPISEERHYYEGTVDGDTIQFTMTTDSPTSTHTPIRFAAKKAIADQTVPFSAIPQ